MANWKKKVKDAEPSQGGGPYVGVGKHFLRLDLVKEVEAFQGDNIVVAEFIVESSDNEDHDHRGGSRVSRLWNMSKFPSAPGNYKAFLLAAWGTLDDDGEFEALPKQDLTDEMIDMATSDDNPLNGALFYCVGTKIITQKNKSEFTKCRWELREYPPAPEDSKGAVDPNDDIPF